MKKNSFLFLSLMIIFTTLSCNKEEENKPNMKNQIIGSFNGIITTGTFSNVIADKGEIIFMEYNPDYHGVNFSLTTFEISKNKENPSSINININGNIITGEIGEKNEKGFIFNIDTTCTYIHKNIIDKYNNTPKEIKAFINYTKKTVYIYIVSLTKTKTNNNNDIEVYTVIEIKGEKI